MRLNSSVLDRPKLSETLERKQAIKQENKHFNVKSCPQLSKSDSPREQQISNPWVAGSSPAGRERLTDSTQIALRRLRGGHSVCRLTGEQRQTPRCYSDFQPCLCAAFLVLSSQPLAQLIARRITLLASASSFCPTITSAHKGHNPGQSFSHWHEGHLCGVSLSFKLIPVRFPFVVRI